jgi:ribosomal-protein-alanine N-acetyltransferase
VCRNEDGALAAKYSLTQIFRGNFQNVYLGYNAFEPLAGSGLMREAMHPVQRHAFADLRLHRLQANVQPGNERSPGLLRTTGWRKEGYAERYLKIGGRWRDHVMFAVTADGIGVGGPRRRA